MTCAVTGANGGLGKATAKGLAKAGATVVLVCRNPERGEQARKEIVEESGSKSVELLVGDLSVQRSVRNLAHELVSLHPRLNVLVNSAAVFTNHRSLTSDGLETMFATNHLGPFLLTNLLLDTLKANAPSRLLTISAPSTTKLDFDDLQGERKFGALHAFGATKACNLLFTYELARRLEGSGVTASVIHPGLVRTNLMKEAPAPIRWITRLVSSSPEKAAETVVYYASSNDVEQLNGKFFKGRKTLEPSAYTSDPAVQKRLWDVSVELTKLSRET